MKFFSIIILIVAVWFFLFGVRLIGYFASVGEKGWRLTECGTNGCSDAVFVLSAAWTLLFFVVIPLILPIVILFQWRRRRSLT